MPRVRRERPPGYWRSGIDAATGRRMSLAALLLALALLLGAAPAWADVTFDGKAPQAIELTDGDGGPLAVHLVWPDTADAGR